MEFHSILHEGATPAALADREPPGFRDLHLDRIVATIVGDEDPYDLTPLFWTPRPDAATVGYRHEVFRDLDRPELLAAVTDFTAGMTTVRGHLARARRVAGPEARQAWFVEAATAYCAATTALAEALETHPPSSRALRSFAATLAASVASEAFVELEADVAAVTEALATVRYTVLVNGRKVRVRRFDGEKDLGAAVEATFAKFGAAEEAHGIDVPARTPADLGHVEARILALVAKSFPGPFRRLARFVDVHRDFPEPFVVTFDREIRFYLAVAGFFAPLRAAGLECCLPAIVDRTEGVRIVDAFDLALAARLVPAGERVVTNDVDLAGDERLLVVTGPNQGGKTTFARTVGQLHHLAALGCPIPAREARLFLADAVFTHFGREEHVETLRGKLEDELLRIRAILERATGDSVVVVNEIFTSTTLEDARILGTELLRRLRRLDATCVIVTFVEELSTFDEATVSLVAEVDPADPAVRTYRVTRRPADGLAYAAALAAKHRLGAADLRERLGC